MLRLSLYHSLIIKGNFGPSHLYTAEPEAFDDEEVRLLLGRLADNVSYGISTLRMRAAKENGEIGPGAKVSDASGRSLKERRTAFFSKIVAREFTLANPAVENLFGVPASKIVGMRYEDLFGEEGAAFDERIECPRAAGRNHRGRTHKDSQWGAHDISRNKKSASRRRRGHCRYLHRFS